MAEAQPRTEASRKKALPKWLFLSPKKAHQSHSTKQYIVDPSHPDGVKSNPDAFPYEVLPNAYNGLRWARTVEGIGVSEVSKGDYVQHVKHASVIGGRGSSKKEQALGEMLAEIAASDFPFIRLTDDRQRANIDYSYAEFAEPMVCPDDVELESFESSREIKGVHHVYSYRSRLNTSRIGYIVEGFPATDGSRKVFKSRQGRYNYMKRQNA